VGLLEHFVFLEKQVNIKGEKERKKNADSIEKY